MINVDAFEGSVAIEMFFNLLKIFEGFRCEENYTCKFIYIYNLYKLTLSLLRHI